MCRGFFKVILLKVNCRLWPEVINRSSETRKYLFFWYLGVFLTAQT